MVKKPLIITFDLETTGLDPQKDHIIEVAAIKWENGEEKEHFSTFVHYSKHLPSYIKKLTGIREEDLKIAPPIEEVLVNFKSFSQNGLMVAHNARFDSQFLRAHGYLIPTKRLLCSLELSRIFLPGFSSYALDSLLKILNIPFDDFHRALSDARSAGKLFWYIWEKVENSSDNYLQKLLTFSFAEDALNLFLNPFREQFSFKDSFQINLPFNKEFKEVKEDSFSLQGNENYLLDLPEIEGWFSTGGTFAKYNSSFELRSSQLEMAKAVSKAFNQEEHLVVEAGTGTGKSLAYLLPAALLALNKGKNVVVATKTINLQEQLLDKELTFLKEVLPQDLKVCLVKGKAHYLCLKKMEDLQRQKIEDKEFNKFFLRLLNWIELTTTGDNRELKLNKEEVGYWSKVRAGEERCLGHNCRWYSSCYLTRLKEKARNSHLLIVNQSLLFSDLISNNKILPEYDYLIIDEAHHLEEEATKAISITNSFSAWQKLLESIDLENNNQGFIERIQVSVKALEKDKEEDKKEEIIPLLEEIKREVEDTKTLAQKFYVDLSNSGEKLLSEKDAVCLDEHIKEKNFWQEIELSGKMLTTQLRALTPFLTKLEDKIKDDEEQKEIEFKKEKIKEFTLELDFLLKSQDANYVYWIEKEEEISLKSAPLNIASFLAENLYETKTSIIFTSATLAVADSFDYFLKRTGLDLISNERLRKLRLESPFYYREQALCAVDLDAPDPRQLSSEELALSLSSELKEILSSLRGRSLVLFTSHQLLKECAFLLRPFLEEQNLILLAQNEDGSRQKIIEEFIKNPSQSIIFGAYSFWEGVDFAKDLLHCVIITRLPFQSPKIPLVRARSELLRKEGINPFYFYHLPDAVLKLKQGFGRLIRTADDWGCVIILDSRIISQSYGRIFLDSLPDVTKIIERREKMLEEINLYFKRNNQNLVKEVENFL